VGQQLKIKTILFQEKKADYFDVATWLDKLALFALPLFYHLDHGEALLAETYENDCSYLHPYFQIRETRRDEEFDESETMTAEDDDDYGAIDMLLSDRDVDWEEHDRLEAQFDLEEEVRPDGFVIITLPDSVFVLAPWDAPDENEETMLKGFDFETIDIPRVPIPCSYSRRS
jgi:hypothetical protein